MGADYAALVAALYAHLGRWQAVADACNGDNLSHSAGYYYQVASGRIQMPSIEACAGIERAPAFHQTLLKRDFSKDMRKKVHIWDDDHAAGALERARIGATWPEVMHLWRLAYDERRREDDEDTEDCQLFGM